MKQEHESWLPSEDRATIARWRERRHWTIDQWKQVAGNDWPAAIARLNQEHDEAVDRFVRAASSHSYSEA